jgi:glycosyltransferase involved in cell wall biosynthesis
MISTDHLMIDRRILQQAKTLLAQGYQVTVASGFECPQSASYEDQGVAIRRFAYDWSQHPENKILKLGRKLKESLNFLEPHKIRLGAKGYHQWVKKQLEPYRAEVVHVHDLPFLWLGQELAQAWGAKLVFDSHEIYSIQESIPAPARYILAKQEKFYLKYARIFSTVNEFIADHFERLYGRRPLVLYNSVPQSQISRDRENSRRRLRSLAELPEQSQVVLYQGWLSPERNLISMVLAAEYLPADAYLIIIGYGDHEKELRAVLNGHPYAYRVKFLGQIPSESILDLTAGADIGLVPYQPIDLNHQLCSPNKFFEFVQSGVPVIGPALPFFHAMAKRFGCVLATDLHDEISIGTAIAELLKLQERLQEMHRNCLVAGPVLCWESEGVKLIEAYDQMLNNSSNN